MRTLLLKLLALTNVIQVVGQDKALIDFTYKSFLIDNNHVTPCILSDSLNHDIRKIVLFTADGCNKTQGLATIDNDVLALTFDVPSLRDTQYVTYDSLTHQIMIVGKLHVTQGCCNGVCGYELTYVLHKVNDIKKIRFKGEMLSNCIDHSNFRIVHGDTINRLDKFGLKQGEWIEFYANQKTKSVNRYINDRLMYGVEYDKHGNIISRTSREGETTITTVKNTGEP